MTSLATRGNVDVNRAQELACVCKSICRVTLATCIQGRDVITFLAGSDTTVMTRFAVCGDAHVITRQERRSSETTRCSVCVSSGV